MILFYFLGGRRHAKIGGVTYIVVDISCSFCSVIVILQQSYFTQSLWQTENRMPLSADLFSYFETIQADLRIRFSRSCSLLTNEIPWNLSHMSVIVRAQVVEYNYKIWNFFLIIDTPYISKASIIWDCFRVLEIFKKMLRWSTSLCNFAKSYG